MEVDRLVEGAFCWAEAGVPDVQVAKAFYSTVLGWSFNDVPLPDGGVYPMATIGGRNVGAVFKIDPKMAAPGAPPMPPSFSNYIQVSDVDAIAKRVGELGGSVIVPPMDVMEEGKMVVFADPTGAVLSAWQPKRHVGFGRMGEHGAPAWLELMTKNIDVSASFYRRLFDWEISQSKNSTMQYFEFAPKGTTVGVGGMMQMDVSFGDMPSHWLPYFAVDNINAAVAAVKEHGGTVCVEPTLIPSVGTFSVVQDPGGATFNVLQLLQM